PAQPGPERAPPVASTDLVPALGPRGIRGDSPDVNPRRSSWTGPRSSGGNRRSPSAGTRPGQFSRRGHPSAAWPAALRDFEVDADLPPHRPGVEELKLLDAALDPAGLRHRVRCLRLKLQQGQPSCRLSVIEPDVI